MDRRAFLSRVAVVGAAVPMLKAATTPSLLAEPSVATPPSVSTPPSDVTVTSVTAPTSKLPVLPKPFWEDRLLLLMMRGLMAPCPNCNTLNWQQLGSFVECLTCGWRDRDFVFMQSCPCIECTNAHFGYSQVDLEPVVETLSRVRFDAPSGLYQIGEGGSGALRPRPVVRRQLNGYDVNQGRIVHHVIEHQFARVICAVKALADHDYLHPHGYEQERQPLGNLVLLGWTMVDCYEWQVDRGEKPPVLYTRDPHGKTTLVQGVQR